MSYSGHIAAPVSIPISGKTYVLSPLTMADLKELESYLQEDAIESVKKNLHGLPPELQLRLIEKAYEDKVARQIGTHAFNQAAGSIKGGIYMLWLAVRKKHPEVGLEQCGEMLTPENTQALIGKVQGLAGFSGVDESDPTKTAPAAGSQTTSR